MEKGGLRETERESRTLGKIQKEKQTDRNRNRM